MKINKNIKGFNLIEVLIAVSLFAIAAFISSNILVDTSQLEKKSSIQNAIYEDLRMVLQTLTNEIQNGTIDYEEYYSYYVIQNGQVSNDVSYGINYGIYGSRFYDPGDSLAGPAVNNPDDLSMECSFPDPLGLNDECEVVYTLSTDLNTGLNPFYNAANTYSGSNAFCDKGVGKNPCNGETDHLFLIDNTGTKKTIIAPKAIDGGMSLGMIKMRGGDLDSNGIIDTFSCLDEFTCTELDTNNTPMPLPDSAYANFLGSNKKVSLPNKSDLNDIFEPGSLDSSQFMPISPLRSSVKAKFIITPVEDPYKAFGESSMQLHPSVTIILTVDLSDSTKEDYPGTFQPLTVQTTVAAGVIGRIDSYPPINQFKNKGGDSYISDIFNAYGLLGNLKTP